MNGITINLMIGIIDVIPKGITTPEIIINREMVMETIIGIIITIMMIEKTLNYNASIMKRIIMKKIITIGVEI